jgi:hypothetical protein
MTQRAFRIRFVLGRRSRLKNNTQLGVELQTNRFCIKKEIYWVTSDRNRTGNCGRCESFDWVISMAFCTETRGSSTVTWLKCLENSASRSQEAPLQNCDCTRTGERDCETSTTLCWELLQNVPRTAVLLFKIRHISTFQAQSSNKIFGTGLSITLGNFTNSHSTAPRLLCGVPFLSLVCGVRTFLKRTMLL